MSVTTHHFLHFLFSSNEYDRPHSSGCRVLRQFTRFDMRRSAFCAFGAYQTAQTMGANRAHGLNWYSAIVFDAPFGTPAQNRSVSQ
ncbi:MAG: hypothetical protein ACI4RE_06210 [Christensenellales bacterium]